MMIHSKHSGPRTDHFFAHPFQSKALFFPVDIFPFPFSVALTRTWSGFVADVNASVARPFFFAPAPIFAKLALFLSALFSSASSESVTSSSSASVLFFLFLSAARLIFAISAFSIAATSLRRGSGNTGILNDDMGTRGLVLGGEGGLGAGRYPTFAVVEVEEVLADVVLKLAERRSATLLVGLRSVGEVVVKVLLLILCLCVAFREAVCNSAT
jgi:hypothetical protein